MGEGEWGAIIGRSCVWNFHALLLPRETRGERSVLNFRALLLPQTMPNHAKPWRAMPNHAKLYQNMPNHAKPCQAMPSHAKPEKGRCKQSGGRWWRGDRRGQ